MPTTTRAGLRYPALSDQPDGPQQITHLAEDADGQLFKAFPCTSTTRPADLTAGDRGFLADESDTGVISRWTGTAWAPVGGGGGGGGFAPVRGVWDAASNQSIPHNADTPVLFGTEVVASSVVTRSAFGVGSKFTLLEAGTYTFDATVRFGSGAAGGNRFAEWRTTSDNGRWSPQGNDGGPGAVTLSLSATDRFDAGTELYVCAAQASGATLALQRSSTSPSLDGFVRVRILKIGG